MPTTITKTIKPNGGGDYLSLSAALAGEKIAHPNLVTGDWILDLVCYPGLDTTGGLFIDTFVTDATHYIQVRVAQRHQGVLVDDGTYYLLDVTNTFGISLKTNYIRLDG